MSSSSTRMGRPPRACRPSASLSLRPATVATREARRAGGNEDSRGLVRGSGMRISSARASSMIRSRQVESPCEDRPPGGPPAHRPRPRAAARRATFRCSPLVANPAPLHPPGRLFQPSRYRGSEGSGPRRLELVRRCEHARRRRGRRRERSCLLRAIPGSPNKGSGRVNWYRPATVSPPATSRECSRLRRSMSRARATPRSALRPRSAAARRWRQASHR